MPNQVSIVAVSSATLVGAAWFLSDWWRRQSADVQRQFLNQAEWVRWSQTILQSLIVGMRGLLNQRPRLIESRFRLNSEDDASTVLSASMEPSFCEENGLSSPAKINRNTSDSFFSDSSSDYDSELEDDSDVEDFFNDIEKFDNRRTPPRQKSKSMLAPSGSSSAHNTPC